MKKITSRTIICFFLSMILVAGTGVFVFRFVTQGGTWAAFTSNRHLYSGKVLQGGKILDRNGTVLAQFDEGKGTWVYPGNTALRMATLHSVGDTTGMIGTGALTRFADKLSGYNLVTGAKPVFSGGRYLYLTLDSATCQAAYTALNGKKGTVGVYNYKTGEILCMVSSPTYDPANPPKIQDGDERYDGVYINRLLSARFIPGSTFKLITATAALETISDLESRTFTCEGKTVVGNQLITCQSAHGEMSFKDALAKSCNCTFGQIASEVGSKTLKKYIEKSGITGSYSVNGIDTMASTYDLSSEDAGDLAWAGIGQGKDLVNPCAMMVYCGAIANRGYAAIPQIIEKTAIKQNVRTSLYINRHTEDLIEADTAEMLAAYMRNNVEANYGSGNFPGLNICAKSGTAQTGGDNKESAWFVGFLQDDEHPYAFVVLVEEGGSGSKVAGRVANTVLQTLVRHD